MAKVRALTTLFHNGFLLKAGEIFDYADEAAAQLTGAVHEGMELVTKKTTSAFAKAQADARKALEDTATSLRAHYEGLKAELEKNPTRGDLVQLVLDAESAARDAEKRIESDLV